jgi:hypothetical protein
MFNTVADELLKFMTKDVGAKQYLAMHNPSSLDIIMTLDFGDGWICQVKIDHRDIMQFAYGNASPTNFSNSLRGIHKKMRDARDEMFLLGERTVD